MTSCDGVVRFSKYNILFKLANRVPPYVVQSFMIYHIRVEAKVAALNGQAFLGVNGKVFQRKACAEKMRRFSDPGVLRVGLQGCVVDRE